MRALSAINYFKAFCCILLSLLAQSSSAQEIKDFYDRAGDKYLNYFIGEGKGDDLPLIKALYYPKLSPLVRMKLDVLRADIDWRARTKKKVEVGEEAIRTLEDYAKGNGSAAALAALSLGDFLWIRSKTSADFSRARGFYLSAIQNSTNRLRDQIIEFVIDRVLNPPWAEVDASYGVYGNYLPSRDIEDLIPTVTSGTLKAELHYLLARSLAAEGGESELVCGAYQEALKLAGQTPFRAQILFDYAQYTPNKCDDSADKLFAEITSKFKNSHYAVKAKKILSLDSGWSLVVSNRRAVSQNAITVNGPSGKKIHLRLNELGLVTDEELTARKVQLGSWIRDEEELLKLFTTPVKSVFDQSLAPGPVEKSRSLPAGPYSVELLGTSERRYLLISDLLVLLSRPVEGKLRLLSVSLKTGTALPDVNIEIERRIPSGLSSKRISEKFTTDVTGLAEFRAPRRLCAVGIQCDPEELVLIARKFRHTGFLSLAEDRVFWPFQGDPSFWIVLSTETPKAGDLVSWNFFVRPDLFKRYKGASVKAEIVHPKGFRVLQPSPTLDEFGRAGGVIKLSKKWSPGKYAIEFSLNIDSSTELERAEFELVSE